MANERREDLTDFLKQENRWRAFFATTWIYIFATLLGGIVAVCFEWMLKGEPSKHADEEAQGAKMKDAK